MKYIHVLDRRSLSDVPVGYLLPTRGLCFGAHSNISQRAERFPFLPSSVSPLSFSGSRCPPSCLCTTRLNSVWAAARFSAAVAAFVCFPPCCSGWLISIALTSFSLILTSALLFLVNFELQLWYFLSIKFPPETFL